VRSRNSSAGHPPFPIGREQRDPYTAADRDSFISDIDRIRQYRDHSSGQFDCGCRPIEVARDDHELVASCSCSRIGDPKSVSQSLGHLHEDTVPDSVAVRVIDELESIQIERQDATELPVRLL
jgi:hypothetical protein